MSVRLPKIRHHKKLITEIRDWISYRCIEQRKHGVVVDLTGSPESVLVAAIASGFKYPHMFTHGVPQVIGVNVRVNAMDAAGYELAQALNIEFDTICIDGTLEAALDEQNDDVEANHLHDKKLVAELRAAHLHNYAAKRDALVLGTNNKEVLSVGAYTLFGEGAVHLNPLGELPRRLVEELVEHMELTQFVRPKPIIGLEHGSPHRPELKCSYDLIELFCEAEEQLGWPAASRAVEGKAKAELKKYNEHLHLWKWYETPAELNNHLKAARREREILRPKAPNLGEYLVYEAKPPKGAAVAEFWSAEHEPLESLVTATSVDEAVMEHIDNLSNPELAPDRIKVTGFRRCKPQLHGHHITSMIYEHVDEMYGDPEGCHPTTPPWEVRRIADGLANLVNSTYQAFEIEPVCTVEVESEPYLDAIRKKYKLFNALDTKDTEHSGPTTPNQVLRALIDTIESTGGIMVDRKGHHVPVGDPDWLDLADVYVKAKEALGESWEPIEDQTFSTPITQRIDENHE